MLLFLPIIGAIAGTAASVASTYAAIKSTKTQKQPAGPNWIYTQQTKQQRDELLQLQQELDALAIQTGQPSYNYEEEIQNELYQVWLVHRWNPAIVQNPQIYATRIARIKAHIAKLKELLQQQQQQQQAQQQQQQQPTQLTQQLQSVPAWLWLAGGGILLLLIAKK